MRNSKIVWGDCSSYVLCGMQKMYTSMNHECEHFKIYQFSNVLLSAEFEFHVLKPQPMFSVVYIHVFNITIMRWKMVCACVCVIVRASAICFISHFRSLAVWMRVALNICRRWLAQPRKKKKEKKENIVFDWNSLCECKVKFSPSLWPNSIWVRRLWKVPNFVCVCSKVCYISTKNN